MTSWRQHVRFDPSIRNRSQDAEYIQEKLFALCIAWHCFYNEPVDLNGYYLMDIDLDNSCLSFAKAGDKTQADLMLSLSPLLQWVPSDMLQRARKWNPLRIRGGEQV